MPVTCLPASGCGPPQPPVGKPPPDHPGAPRSSWGSRRSNSSSRSSLALSHVGCTPGGGRTDAFSMVAHSARSPSSVVSIVRNSTPTAGESPPFARNWTRWPSWPLRRSISFVSSAVRSPQNCPLSGRSRQHDRGADHGSPCSSGNVGKRKPNLVPSSRRH